MNDDLQKQLAVMLAKLTDVASDATTWAGQQIPPLVQEKIVFGRVNETAQFIFALGFIYLGYYAGRRLYALGTTSDDEAMQAAGVVGVIVSCIACLVGFFCACMQFEAVAMVWFAPRLYIVEWLRGMVSK